MKLTACAIFNSEKKYDLIKAILFINIIDVFVAETNNFVGLSDLTDNRNLWRQLLAECLGTFLLVSVGLCSTIAFENNKPTNLQIAITFGLIVATVVQVIR